MAIWKEYFENAYIACFHYLVRKKLHWSERIFWLMAILICMGSTYYIIAKCINKYNNEKPTFRADTDYLDWDTTFPSVVFCEIRSPKFTVYRSKLNNLLGKLVYNATDENVFKETVLDSVFMRPPVLNSYRSCNQSCLLGNYSVAMREIRRTCPEILANCQYNNENFTCCDYFLPVETSYGQCFAFNNIAGRHKNGSTLSSLKWKISRRSGVQEGTLLVDTKSSSLAIYVLGPHAVPNANLETYRINPMHQSSLVDGMIYYHYLKIEETLAEERLRLLDIDRRGCRYPDENNLTYFDLYTEAHCQIECGMEAQKKVCGCVGHTYPIPLSEECNITGLLCITENKRVASYTQDECYCYPDCNFADIRTVGFVLENIKNIPKSSNLIHPTKSTVMRYVAIVPAPSVRNIRYSATSSLDVLVLVGGTVGFFIGFSFLSIAQVLYYIFVRTLTDMYRLRKKTSQSKKQRKMDEYFALARAKLRVTKVESEIKGVLGRKVNRIKDN